MKQTKTYNTNDIGKYFFKINSNEEKRKWRIHKSIKKMYGYRFKLAKQKVKH